MTTPAKNVLGRLSESTSKLAEGLAELSVELESERALVRALILAMPSCEGGCGSPAVTKALFHGRRDPVLVCGACSADVEATATPTEPFERLEDLSYREELEALLNGASVGMPQPARAENIHAGSDARCPECQAILVFKADPDPNVKSVLIDCAGQSHVVTYSDGSEAYLEPGEPPRYAAAITEPAKVAADGA